MDHFAGLDVSVKETSICIVDDAGKIVREVKVASEPEALLVVLKNLAFGALPISRIVSNATLIWLSAVSGMVASRLRSARLIKSHAAPLYGKSVCQLPYKT